MLSKQHKNQYVSPCGKYVVTGVSYDSVYVEGRLIRLKKFSVSEIKTYPDGGMSMVNLGKRTAPFKTQNNRLYKHI